jgi:diguanylate cyclase (GGDEF)-like protein
MPDATREMTRERAERLREHAGHIHAQFEGQTLEAVTLSLGVAVFPEDGSTSAAVLKAADDALYRAKREGRGQVAVADHNSG